MEQKARSGGLRISPEQINPETMLKKRMSFSMEADSNPEYLRGGSNKPVGNVYREMKSIAEGTFVVEASARGFSAEPARARGMYSPTKMDRPGSTDARMEAFSRTRKGIHLQSADLFDNFSPVQKERQLWKPDRPDCFSMGERPMLEEVPEIKGLIQQDQDSLKECFPSIFSLPIVKIRSATCYEEERDSVKLIRIGLVLSGGPAPGGHNVISGVFDYIKRTGDSSQLFGFMEGLDGLFQKKYRIIDNEMMDRFRNTGGFDMLWSGRGRITGVSDMELARQNCEALDLNGLIIIGGDGSNSNAALLSEYFGKANCKCSVVGIPKTIDGDLKNAAIEVSFGFDTATKTYSELIGNLCTDICCGQKIYHFVRLMGRSASHIVMECAMQTRPNLVFIGEEIEAKGTTLKQIVDEILNLMKERHKMNKDFGIVLVPEGLIEFIPEMKRLIEELNPIFGKPVPEGKSFEDLLTKESKDLWNYLPAVARDPLLAEREATGYLQVAKIPTEKLLATLVETQLIGAAEMDDYNIEIATHYFGYEGRCAMPSNFDASYCYALGMTGACLIHNKRNGYMAVVKELDQDPSMWEPTGVPFCRLMQVKMVNNNTPQPAIIRQLVDIHTKEFAIFCEARQFWKTWDVYRCPGPIQFTQVNQTAGPENFCVLPPKDKSQLLANNDDDKSDPARGVVVKYWGALSSLQLERLCYKPACPDLCRDKLTIALETNPYLPKDPYALRQLLLYYPHLCKRNKFNLHEYEKSTFDAIKRQTHPLRVGIVFISRQSPGMMNVVWGLHERMKLSGGVCIGLCGAEGLYEGKHLEINDMDMRLYKNLGGVELLGKATDHGLLDPENRERVRATCIKLDLSAIVLVGSSLGLTEASLLSEHFLMKGCRTCVIGVPATGSNNVLHKLIETNIGFDTSSKVYASLIGNVLTDAASMPKYWHFVRLMGRQPSNVVLECALQTHPNIVIIAEEYGAAQKSLADVVNDIANVICLRAEAMKNFGSVLIPDGLLAHLPGMKSLLSELDILIKYAITNGTYKSFRHALLDFAENPSLILENNKDPGKEDAAKLSPWSFALFRSLPEFIRKELLRTDMGELRVNLVETEHLLGFMVKEELERRKANGDYKGKFQYVTHFFGYQGMSAMPSQFDANLAFSYGMLAGIAAECNVTGHCLTIRGLCGDVSEWRLGSVPFNCFMTLVPSQQEIQIHPTLVKSRKKQTEGEMPIIPNAEVNLDCKAYKWMRLALQQQWTLQDRFCNPGPIQFQGPAANFYHRILHEEQSEYWNMLRCVEDYTSKLQKISHFGIDEQFLKTAYVTLNGLLALCWHPEDLLAVFPPIAGTDESEWQYDREESSRVNSGVLQRALTSVAAVRVSSLLYKPGEGLGNSPCAVDHSLQALRRVGSKHVDSGWGIGKSVEDLPSQLLASQHEKKQSP